MRLNSGAELRFTAVVCESGGRRDCAKADVQNQPGFGALKDSEELSGILGKNCEQTGNPEHLSFSPLPFNLLLGSLYETKKLSWPLDRRPAPT